MATGPYIQYTYIHYKIVVFPLAVTEAGSMVVLTLCTTLLGAAQAWALVAPRLLSSGPC